MRQRNIPKSHEVDEFVEGSVQPAEYQDATEAIRDAQHALRQRRQENALKVQRLRQQIEEGIADLDSGDALEIDDADLDAYIEGLGRVEGN